MKKQERLTQGIEGRTYSMCDLLDFNGDGNVNFTEKVIGVMLVEKLLDAQACADEYDAADGYDPEGESEDDDEEF